ncbi:dehydrase and lipid transport-domain-containing protein [Phaeosphaeriaceae sp. PMI808]|nr:dehydrase and lipid transport-domain-containing protein [Phaeosphaeriaceae sp. PMI808]
MVAPKTARPLLQSPRRLCLSSIQRRSFLQNPFDVFSDASSATQKLTAHRTLPYPSAPIYSIIADIPSYASFVPFCQRSDITHWSAPDPIYSRCWPSEGSLTSGFGGVTESFTSRVYCVPGKYVESVGGNTEPSLLTDEISHHLNGPGAGSASGTRRMVNNDLLKHLRSKWTIEELAKDSTSVTLALEYAFANPFYAALSGGVAPKVAEAMIKAFEERVVTLLKENPGMAKATLSELDGSKLKS